MNFHHGGTETQRKAKRTTSEQEFVLDSDSRFLNCNSGLCPCIPPSRRVSVVDFLRPGETTLLKVGLTGGIASGKSVVGEMFVKLGAHLILADTIAHELMQPGQGVYEKVVRHFGREILNSDGSVNRPKLAEIAFGHPGSAGRVQELNAIVHPAVVEHENQWMEGIGRRDPHGIAIVEAALILEAGVADRFDRLMVVTCSPEQRVQRFAGRLGVSEEAARVEVTRRMAAQLPDKEKIKAADFVIDNSGSLDRTAAQVHKVFAALQDAARASAR